MMATISVIVVSVTLVGILFFVIVKRTLKKKLEFYLKNNNNLKEND